MEVKKVTIHQLYDAFIRAVEFYRAINFKKDIFEAMVVTPIIGKKYVEPIKLKFKLIERNVVLITKIEISHKFSKTEIFGEKDYDYGKIIKEIENGTAIN